MVSKCPRGCPFSGAPVNRLFWSSANFFQCERTVSCLWCFDSRFHSLFIFTGDGDVIFPVKGVDSVMSSQRAIVCGLIYSIISPLWLTGSFKPFFSLSSLISHQILVACGASISVVDIISGSSILDRNLPFFHEISFISRQHPTQCKRLYYACFRTRGSRLPYHLILCLIGRFWWNWRFCVSHIDYGASVLQIKVLHATLVACVHSCRTESILPLFPTKQSIRDVASIDVPSHLTSSPSYSKSV